jgi:hypothetical protein
MRNRFFRFSFLFLPFFCFLAGCGILGSSPQPPTPQVTCVSTSPALYPQPATLQVTRVSTSGATQRSWTITDVNCVQQLFQVIQHLPRHYAGSSDMCTIARYDYSLNFLVSRKSLQKDDLGGYCGTLTLENGIHLDRTDTFNSLFGNMLNVNNL